MNSLFLGCIFATVVAPLSSEAENIFDVRGRLEKMLLRDYIKEARPVKNVNENVTITVGISLYLIKNMDDKNQMLTTSLWIRQIWHDPRLKWSPSNFSDEKAIHLPANKIWVPDIKVYNEVTRGLSSGLDQFQTRVVVENDGKVKWMGPTVLRTSCKVDIKMFPFDTQTCRLKIGSWTYDGFAVDVRPEDYTMDTSKSPSNLEWELVMTSVERNVQTYPCCSEPYPDVTYTITMKRRKGSYGLNFIFPAMLLTGLTGLAFVTVQERVGLVLTCLVSMIFFLKMVAERTPTSDTVPLLSIFLVILSFEVTLTFYAVCVTLNAYFKRSALSKMSSCLREVVIERLGRVWGVTSVSDEIKDRLKALQSISDMAKRKHRDCRSDSGFFNGEHLSGKLESRSFREETVFKLNEFDNASLKSASCYAERECCVKKTYCEESGSISKDRNADCLRNLKTSYADEQTNGGLQKQAFQSCKYELCKEKSKKNRCFSVLNEMIAVNHRLLANLQEINYVAKNLDYKRSQKERWLLSATILDRSFFILFLLMFIFLSLVNFLL